MGLVELFQEAELDLPTGRTPDNIPKRKGLQDWIAQSVEHMITRNGGFFPPYEFALFSHHLQAEYGFQLVDYYAHKKSASPRTLGTSLAKLLQRHLRVKNPELRPENVGQMHIWHDRRGSATKLRRYLTTLVAPKSQWTISGGVILIPVAEPYAAFLTPHLSTPDKRVNHGYKA